MPQQIDFIDIGVHKKAIASLASTIEEGLTSVARQTTDESAISTCSRVERMDLAALLQASTTPLTAMEIPFEAGLRGKTLVIMRTKELQRLGECITGLEAQPDEWPSAEILNGCLGFVTTAMECSDRRFAETQGKKVVAGKPELVSPASLPQLQDSYQSALCITYQLILKPELKVLVQVLTQSALFASLVNLLEEGESGGEPEDAAPERPARPMEKKTMSEMPSGSGKPTSPSGGDQDSGVQGNWNIDLLLDVDLPLVVSFGETAMPLKDVLKLGVGSVIELDKTVNDPVTLIVNQKPIARGEVVMVEGNYGVRILEVESTADRIRSLG
jgi:flagellar motor switch protein FliN